jgi:predicted secreted protein
VEPGRLSHACGVIRRVRAPHTVLRRKSLGCGRGKAADAVMSHLILCRLLRAAVLVAAASSVLLAGGCQSRSAVAGRVHELVAADAGRTVVMRLGDMLNVTLSANPSTSLQWAPAADSTPLLLTLGEPLFMPGGPGLGDGGKATLTFRAVEPGSGDLKLLHQRSFGHGPAETETFHARVLVR